MRRLLITPFFFLLFAAVFLSSSTKVYANTITRVGAPCNFKDLNTGSAPYLNQINLRRGHVVDSYGSWRHAVDLMANGLAGFVDDDPIFRTTTNVTCGTDTTAYASISGTVSKGYDSGRGNWFKISGFDGSSVEYEHFANTIISNGSFVQSGVKIGQIGCTGNCSGEHIHFIVRRAGSTLSYNSDFSTLTDQWKFVNTRDIYNFAGKYDSDNKSDIVAYYPDSSTWVIGESGRADGYTNPRVVQFGWEGVIPVTGGDYDNDGRTDIGVYDPRTGDWYIAKSSLEPNSLINPTYVHYGWAGVIPLFGGDYDGDNITDIGIVDPNNMTWYIARSTQGQFTKTFGWAGTNPIMGGDYDGDGKTDIALVDPSSSTWYIAKSRTASPYTEPYILTYGWSGVMPVTSADYDGDGITDIAVLSTSNMIWYYRKSSTNQDQNTTFAWPGTVPLFGGDYDGDGKTDFGVLDANTSTWYFRGELGGNFNRSIGGTNFIPI